MNLYFRLLKVLFSQIWRPKLLSILDKSVLTFRVWPNDLDCNWHMNNGRYLTVMDLGRMDLVVRSGMSRAVSSQDWIPILSSAAIRYRLELKPFQKFHLETHIVGWDDSWFYIEQRFIHADGDKAGAVAALALVKGVKSRIVPFGA